MKDAYDVRHRLYFAYGSNMNAEQIGARCHEPHVLGLARLMGHKLAFFGSSKRWDGAEETIVQAPGDELWGVIYKLNFSSAEQLDSWQDVRLDGTGPYFHFPTDVIDADSIRHSVLLYKRNQLGEPQLPSREYLDYIIAGARTRGLPGSYIERLSLLSCKKAGYTVPLKSRSNRGLLIDHCSACNAD
jgi:gamma-glutamylcyclotransferase